MARVADLTEASWREFNRLLDAALEVPPEQRLAWIETLGPEHDALKATLRAVLARLTGVETGGWLETLPHTAGAATLADDDLQAGSLVGPYRLLGEIGVGGMGAVWLAERADGTLKRKVALKLPRATWSRGLAERLARERDILAALEHPNIARLYDAGTDAKGRPFLALEYVEGLPIDAYCSQHSLGIKGRLQLLLQVAHAVAFAHSRLVVHRDLKPSNILVGADGQVRLLDFGIAKLMEGDRAQETQLTQVSGRALTPDYASPEQIRGEPIGTASDVYSLGVVAFELLTGQRPYRLKRGSVAEIEEAVVAADVPLASSVTADHVARRALRGDLDAILNQALRKDQARRYPSVSAFADDLERHLRGQPVQARPDSLAYRLRKFVGRNKVTVGASAAVALALVGGAAVALWQANVATREARTSEVVQDFVLDIFRMNSGKVQDPVKARATTARELLDIGASRVDESLKDAPEARIRMLKTLADMYIDLELDEKAAELDEKRLALLRERGDRREIAAGLMTLANALQSTKQRDRIRPLLEEAREHLDAVGDRDSSLRGELFVRLARLYFNISSVQARDYADEAARIFSKLPEQKQFQSTSLIVGARARMAIGDFRDAADRYREALAVLEANPQPLHFDISVVRYALGNILFLQQRYDEALAITQASVKGVVDAFGEEAPNAMAARARLAALQHAVGQRNEARAEFERLLETVVRVRGEDDPLYTPLIRTDAARAWIAEGRFAEGANLIERVAEVDAKNYSGSFVQAQTLHLLSNARWALGRLDESRALLDESEKAMAGGTGKAARPWRFNYVPLLRAQIELSAHQPDAALAALARFTPLPPEESPPPAQDTVDWHALRAFAYLQKGDLEAAHKDATQAADGAAQLEKRGTLPGTLADANLVRGLVAMKSPQAADCKRWLDRALALRQAHDVPTSPWLARTHAIRGQCLLAAGDHAGAAADAAQAANILRAHASLSAWFTEPRDELQRALGRGK